MHSAKNAASILPLLLAASFLTHYAHAQPAPNTQAAPYTQVWVASWAASQQIPEPANSIPPGDLRDATLRQLVRLSIGGPTLRVHLSTAFGTEPLRFTSVHIARPLSLASSAIDPQSDRPLTFSGAAAVTVPAGAEVLSDPIDDPVPPLTSLAITFHLDEPPSPETGHPGSRATSYYLHGDQVSAPTLTGATPIEHWYQLAAIDVLAPPSAASIVALGDSTTDGHATTTNGNNRWTDVLAERLQASPATRNIAVLNQGIGGNHLLTDGLGPNVLARFDRDVVAQTGVRWLIVFEGINDLGGLTRLHEVSPENTPRSSLASSPRISRSSSAPTPTASASSAPPSPPTADPTTTIPARPPRPTARPSMPGFAPPATSTASSTSTRPSAIPPTPTACFQPKIAATTCTPTPPATEPWPKPSTSPSSPADTRNECHNECHPDRSAGHKLPGGAILMISSDSSSRALSGLNEVYLCFAVKRD